VIWKAGAALLIGRELYITLVERRRTRRRLFALSKARAEKLGRPLLVIGDPEGGFVNRALKDYDCGDECLDLTGCPSCPVVQHKGRAEDILPTLPANSRVIFVSCVLSYVDDIEAVKRELFRVAGSPENLFVAHVEPTSLTAWIYPGSRRRILSAPPETPDIRTAPLAPWK